MTMTGGDLLLDLFEAYGIEYIFCSPGTEWAPIWEGMVKRDNQGNRKLKYINCRHETLAVSMAQGYAESTGRLAAVLIHSGVGTLNGAMAIRTAYFAKSPMLIMSGETYEHSGESGVRPQGWHWLGLLSDIGGPSSLVKGYVKWSNSIRSKDGMIDAVYRGIQIAKSPVPGPVFITISPELLGKQLPEQKISRPFSVPINIELPLEGVEEAAEWLIKSQKPVILTEYAGKNTASVRQLVELAELLNIPVYEFLAFSGNFPKNHPLYLGDEAAQALAEADTVLVVGSVAPWYPPSVCFRDNMKIILLDDDSLHENIPQWGYRIDLSLTVDIERGLAALNDIIKAKIGQDRKITLHHKERLALLKGQHEQMILGLKNEAISEKNNLPISAKWFLQKVQQTMPENAIYVDETILHTRFVHRYLAEPGNYFRPTYGGLGVGFGEAIGIKLANPDRPVVLIIGDGTFHYNPAMAGLGLCQEYNIPIMILLFNNGGYAAMRRGHIGLFPQGAAVTNNTFLGVDITPAPDYVKIAEAFGAYGEQLKNPEDIIAVLKRGLQQLDRGKAALLDVLLE